MDEVPTGFLGPRWVGEVCNFVHNRKWMHMDYLYAVDGPGALVVHAWLSARCFSMLKCA